MLTLVSVSKTPHVYLEHLKVYAAGISPLSEDEHAHIARCLACQELLGQCLAESNSEEEPPQNHT
jgi:hypothetical protein